MNIKAPPGKAGRLLALLCLCGVILCSFPCTALAGSAVANSKNGNMSFIYGFLFLLSGILLLGYCVQVKKKMVWFMLLYSAVFVANGGYFAMSMAGTLETAILANQCSYFGSAMLPLSMLMIIIQTCRLKLPKWAAPLLVAISLAAFLLAASGSDLGLYYREVFLQEVNGTFILRKIYGPLHFLYSVYLFSYFAMMLTVIVYANICKLISSCKYVVFLACAVFGNLAVWFVEQLIRVDFEFLAVSYIASELLLLLVHSMMQDYDLLLSTKQMVAQTEPEQGIPSMPPDMEELFTAFSDRAGALTATERMILRHYADGRDVSETAELAFISINTIRKHNANIYRKLMVGSRDELMLYIELFRRCGRLDEILQPTGTCEK